MAREINAKINEAPAGRSDGWGVDHQLTIAIFDGEEYLVDGRTCPIPRDQMQLVVDAINAERTNAQIAAIYRPLIMQYYGATPVIDPPPAFPGLSDLQAVDAWFDANEAYKAELAANVAEAAAQAAIVDTWIRDLNNFTEYPYPFVLQQAS